MKKKKIKMPHTFVIIFGVVCLAALLTAFIPLGKYETTEVTYMQNGAEKTRTVLDPESFEYVLDENGNNVTSLTPLFGTEDFGKQGVLNYVFEGVLQMLFAKEKKHEESSDAFSKSDAV